VVIIAAAVAVVSFGVAAAIVFTFGPARFGMGLPRAGAGTAGIQVDEKESIEAAGLDSIAIGTVSENIRLREGAGERIEVRFHGTVRATSPDRIPRLQAGRNGAAADIALARSRTVLDGFYWSDLVLEVTVPAGYAGRLRAESVSGDIELADHDGYAALALTTVSGDVRAGSLRAGELRLRTTSGDLRAEAVKAQAADLASVSGNLEVRGLTGDTRAHSTSGEVSLGYEEVPQAIDIQSTSGDVTLLLPGEAEFRLDARSTSGELSCGFPIRLSESRSGGGRRVIAGEVGSSGSGVERMVKVRTVSGDIRVDR
jgi:hypothetical protein